MDGKLAIARQLEQPNLSTSALASCQGIVKSRGAGLCGAVTWFCPGVDVTLQVSAPGRVTKIAIDKRAQESENKVMRKVCVMFCLLLAGCAAKKQPVAATPPPIRSQLPPPSAEVIEHCVVIKQENANTVTCSCLPGTTVIDSKTRHTTLVCKIMKEEK